MKKLSLITRIIICLMAGIGIGLLCNILALAAPIRILVTLGDLFGNFLSFMIPLIIIGFIVPGIASLGKKSGKGLLVTTGIAYTSTIIAGLLAFLVGQTFLPLLIQGNNIFEESSQTITSYFSIDIPAIMGVMSALVLAFVLGIGLSGCKESILLTGMHELNQVVLKVVQNVLIPFVPIYIGCIFAKISFSGEIITTLKSFGMVYVILLALQMLYILIQYSIAGLVKKQNPLKMIQNMLPAYFTAVGTQSSAATIPVTLSCAKKNHINEEVLSFVIPLGATIHLAGDTITLVLTSMAVMLMKGEVPTFGTMMPFILMLGVTMVAAPGVPGGGVMAALGLLESMLGFGALEKPLMIALHAAQDSFGTATNISGDGAIAALVESILDQDALEIQTKNSDYAID